MLLYRKMREGIVSGAWAPGARLPSKRTLAAENAVSVVTVEHAYSLLCDEGYAESLSYSPILSVPVGKNETGAETGASETAAAEAVPHFPSSVLARAMRKVMAEQGEKLLVKSPNSGLPELKDALSAYLMRSRGIRADAGRIVIGSGAEYLYGVIVQLLGRERIYALEDPSYEKIRRVYEMNGARTEPLTMGNDGILSSALEQSRAGVLHVTPYNSYPSRVTASASKRAEYIRWALARGAYVVEDDYDSEFTLLSKPEDTLLSLDTGRVLYLNLVLPPELLPVYEKKMGFVSCTVPVFEQYLLAELIASGDFERHVNRIRRQRRKRP